MTVYIKKKIIQVFIHYNAIEKGIFSTYTQKKRRKKLKQKTKTNKMSGERKKEQGEGRDQVHYYIIN